MITVRFPSGFSVQYNSAHRLEYIGNNGVARLFSGDKWVADVPREAIVESISPCRTYNANTVDDGAIADEFIARLRSLNVYKLADAKRALAKFDSLRKRWKE